jgi:hypothetical protein|tara:strand:+ start:64 stop:261 length:198 start_codon:yes stop_codon:yes gene_type:complete
MTKIKRVGKCICVSIPYHDLHLLDMIDENRCQNGRTENRSSYLLRLVEEDYHRIQEKKFNWLKDF